MRVVLPAPFGPNRPKTSPGDTRIEQLTKASDESLNELNDLLDSVEMHELEQQELDEIKQENKING